MITMEFEEMKKIWDEQNQEQLYAINETALHRRISVKKKGSSRLNNINDFGLLAVVIFTSIILLLTGPSLYDYLLVTILLLIGGYIVAERIQRKRTTSRFNRTILSELDHAIANVEYEAKRSRTMIWWFIIPLAVPSILGMIYKGAPLWAWIVVPCAFIVSYVLVRWEFNHCHLPKKQKLEALRAKLMEEVNENP